MQVPGGAVFGAISGVEDLGEAVIGAVEGDLAEAVILGASSKIPGGGVIRRVAGKATTLHKVRMLGLSGHDASTDIPSWASDNAPLINERGRDFAQRLLDKKYGPGNYPKGPGSEFSKLPKYADRAFENP